MNCNQCLTATVGFLSAYWLTLAVSLCVAGAAALLFWWYLKNEWPHGEEAKFDMLRRG